MSRTILLFCVLAAAFCLCSAVPWKDCGSKKGKVKNVFVTNCDKSKICDLKKGTNVTFEVDFTPNEMVTKATSVVHGLIAKVPLPFPIANPNACVDSNLQCPLKPKVSVSYKAKIFVKPVFPKVRLIVEWEMKDQNGADIFCVELPAQIVG